MSRSTRLNRWFVSAAGVVLAGTAAFHATGYASVSQAIQTSSTSPFLVAAVKALWLMFSAHLLILSIVVISASRTPRAKWVVLACALFPASDTILLTLFVGLFSGTFLLAGATVLLVVGALLQPGCER